MFPIVIVKSCLACGEEWKHEKVSNHVAYDFYNVLLHLSKYLKKKKSKFNISYILLQKALLVNEIIYLKKNAAKV